jgi:fructose-bisphosphate aldolase class II
VTLARTRDLVDAAVAARTAVPAFNVITLEHAEGIVTGASAAGTAVLLQVSENAIRYHGGFAALLAGCREIAAASATPVGIHLDHIEDVELAYRCLARAQELGVTSIMFDASTLEYSQNLAATSAFAKRAQAAGLWVEAELGAIGGKGGAHTPGVRTQPGQAASFTEETGVDGLAVAVGSSHAMVDRSASLDIELVSAIALAVDVPLVLHGSSGVPDATLARAVRAGIRKVNVGTALNIAYTGSIRVALDAEPNLTDPRRYTAPGRDAIAAVVHDLCAVIAA